MNNIFKKIISAAIAVSTLGSIALPVYAAETPEVSEDNITTAEATEKFSVKDGYYKYLKMEQKFATIIQSLDESDVIYPNGSDGDSYVEGIDEDGMPYKYRVEIAPNGHLYRMHDTTSQEAWLLQIQRAIDKGDSKVIDGRTFVTIEGVDYEYYIGTIDDGAKYADFYWNLPCSYDVPSYVGFIVWENFYKIDNIFDAVQEGCELYKEAIENDTLAYGYCMNHKYVDGKTIYSMPDDEEVFNRIRYEVLDEICLAFSYANSFDDLSDELKEKYDQSTDEIKSIANWIFEKHTANNELFKATGQFPAAVNAQVLLESYAGDINGDKLIDMNDVTLLKKQLIHKVELSPMQQKMTSTNGESKLDVRDVTNLTQYLVKMTDSIN